MVRTCKGLLRKMKIEDPDLCWEIALPQVQGALNFTTARATGLLPAEVFLGVQPTPPNGAILSNAPPLLRDASDQDIANYTHQVGDAIAAA